MYTITRTRARNATAPVLMQDDGEDYYTCLLNFGDGPFKVNNSVVIMKDARDIRTERTIRESVVVGPLPLSSCHRMALNSVQKGRGFASKRGILEAEVNRVHMNHIVTHLVY